MPATNSIDKHFNNDRSKIHINKLLQHDNSVAITILTKINNHLTISPRTSPASFL